MSYGRLDVYYPDGRVDSFSLNDAVVTIGRASNNTITLDTDTISRQHCQITQQNNVVSLTDLGSENGIYADGVRLKSHQPYLLTSTEEFQMGYLRVIYHPIDETVTSPMNTTEETQRIERELEAFTLVLDESEVHVWPASSSSVELGIHNHTDVARIFFVTISGLPSDWVRLNRPTLEVQPKSVAHALISIKPPRQSDITPQMYRLTVEVTPATDDTTPARAEVLVYVRGFSGFGMAIAPRNVELDDPLTLYMQNQGSEDLTLAVSARNPDNALAFSFTIPRITLGAGERAQVRVRATPRQRALVGKPTTYPLTVVVQAQNAARFTAAISATLTVAPRLPSWAAISVTGVLVGLLLAGLLALASLLTPRTPTLSTLSANTLTLAQGDALTLSWEAENVTQFKLSVNDTLLQTLDGDARQATVDTSTFGGQIAVSLIAEGADGVVTQSVTAFVYRPLNVLEFTTMPNALVRRVITPLTLSWQVEGASTLRLEGLENFTNQEVPLLLDAQGAQTFYGYTNDSLTLTLFLQDEVGNVKREQRTLEAVDAQCTATRTLALHEGADERHPQSSVVSEGTRLVALARNTESTWLQVRFEGINAWAETAALACDDTFTIENLLIEANAPALPTLTPAPTATAAP